MTDQLQYWKKPTQLKSSIGSKLDQLLKLIGIVRRAIDQPGAQKPEAAAFPCRVAQPDSSVLTQGPKVGRTLHLNVNL